MAVVTHKYPTANSLIAVGDDAFATIHADVAASLAFFHSSDTMDCDIAQMVKQL